jgi:hypothetical protein
MHRAARARSRLARLWLAALLLTCLPALAQSATPAPRPDEQFDFMNLLHARGLHDIHDEDWNAYGQFTYLSSWKNGFSAPYTNLNGSTGSLSTAPERSFTATLTLYLGLRLWPGAEFYLVPELISERPLSQLKGLAGAIQNFELQKGGGESLALYRSRMILKQTFGLGGERVVKESDPMQLGVSYDRRRLVLVVGNFSTLDLFDRNSVLGDLRQSFFSLSFLTYAAWDFSSDARGYAWGAAAELYWDDWAVRLSRMTPPALPNQLPVTFQLDRFYGDQLELEHTHHLFGQEGVVRLVAYRNRVVVGRFDEALQDFQAHPGHTATTCTGFNYGSQNASAPDLCWVRRPNVKLGVGLSLEQHLTPDVGIFVRGMYSDGETEVDAYTSTDRSLSLGVVGRGSLWSRRADVAGVGLSVGWISAVHAEYLRLGGVDGFLGDGNLEVAPETTLELFYSVNFLSSLWLSVDFQRILAPGFNAARGPVDVFGVRLHAEF